MPTTWTQYSPTAAETWTQLDPFDGGFGKSPFGDPTTPEPGITIHKRGFGDPITPWKNYDETP